MARTRAAGESGGRIPEIRSAGGVFPDPGGPTRRSVCPQTEFLVGRIREAGRRAVSGRRGALRGLALPPVPDGTTQNDAEAGEIRLVAVSGIKGS